MSGIITGHEATILVEILVKHSNRVTQENVAHHFGLSLDNPALFIVTGWNTAVDAPSWFLWRVQPAVARGEP